ncbi:hypothetical protein GCK72_024975 [Caenorhabditis remanei]|uniref:Uncharacterized protein n=1 Tax=Caenorhabditis remanei TaxID=31234 RepID=A0A6A5G0P6_CAERE|nr:hypothetical protein GCK72_024975 [Caenorhabditis remanei]KAF1748508.1 hypothetical protein GCK72_024975 [Caenorhabditis remanei]
MSHANPSQDIPFRGLFGDNNSNECPVTYRQYIEYRDRLNNLATLNYLEELGIPDVKESVSKWLDDANHGPNYHYDRIQ